MGRTPLLGGHEELIAIGEAGDRPIERTEFIDTARDRLAKLIGELEAARDDLVRLTSGPMRTVSLMDGGLSRFAQALASPRRPFAGYPGEVPVYSCFTEPRTIKGKISGEWLAANGIHELDRPVVTVMANGASAVGRVFVRRERCVVTDDVIVVELLTSEIDADYLAAQLRSEIERGNFVYEAKLFAGLVRLRFLVDLPLTETGDLDLAQQRAIASALVLFDAIRAELSDLGTWTGETVRIA